MSLYKPEEVDWSKMDECMKRNQEQLDSIDREAKENGQLLHRYIQEPFADGFAVYQIIRVNKKTVRIRHCSGLGDDWMIPYWGEEATIDYHYAAEGVAHRDRIATFFANKRLEQNGKDQNS